MAASPWLGVIADDYTGATDIAGMIARAGMRVVQYIGVPQDAFSGDDVDCVVIALKSRSCPPEEAVQKSRESLDWLRATGARQIFFKYCSTFDSTDRGNIGPVADALADRLSAKGVIFCPSVPELGRTTYQGHLFVADTLLSESTMRHHPINPMTDSDLRRVLGRQSARSVGLVPLQEVRKGADAVAALLSREEDYVIVDAVDDEDLATIAEAVKDAPLVTGGSGLGAALASSRRQGVAAASPPVTVPEGPTIVLAGSCSAATQEQLRIHAESHPIFPLDVYALDRGEDVVAQAVSFLEENRDQIPAVVAGVDAQTLQEVQANVGLERSAALVESALAEIAERAAASGVRRIMVAGGETSGAVVNALGIDALDIGIEVAPGVPWMVSRKTPSVAVLLKSGNFGGPDVFRRAVESAGAT